MSRPAASIQIQRAPVTRFTREEDEKLRFLVRELGTSEWVAIAGQMRTRTTRQCRERWQNYLRPDIKNGPWTEEEEELLVAKYREYGPIWRAIALFFPKRTDVDIKNCWNRRQRRLSKIDSRRDTSDDPIDALLLDAEAEIDVWDWSVFTA
jgi:hypothetical protein